MVTESDRSSAIVVGAGVFGAGTALALARRGWRVTLLEQAVPGHPGASSGGVSRLLRFSHGADRWYTDMAWAARHGWRRVEAETGRDLLAETGLVWFARTADGWEADSLRVCAEAGVPVERLTPDEVAALFPAGVRTDDLAFGLWEPHGGVLRAREATMALADLAVRHGATLRDGVRARPAGDAVAVGDEILRADRVVWACGPWLRRLHAGGVELTVTQQDTCFFAVPPAWRADRVPAWVDFAGAAYGAGDLDGMGFKCSSDRQGPEFDPDWDDRVPLGAHITAARETLAYRFPALADAPLAGTRTCQYTTTADTHFLIGPLDGDRVWLVGGGSGHGFKHGPALGEYVADLLEGRRAPDPRLGLSARSAGTSLRTAGHGAAGHADGPDASAAAGSASAAGAPSRSRWYEAPIETRLRDGTPVLVRMVEAADKDAFAAGMERLSTRSRYLRFHTGVEQLTDEQLRYLTDVDQRDHVAWVAVALDGDEETGIGVARFVRLDDEPDVAEAAITVIDDYQGRGLGTLLLGVLATAAARRGVKTFRSYVLGENVGMLAVFDALGAERSEVEPGVYRVDLAVPDTPAGLTDTPLGMVIRAVTGRRLPRMRTTAPPVWVGGEAERPMLREWLDRVLDRTVRSGGSRGRGRQGGRRT
jgi:glycine/D-amino acid oxidase-like deaminating enzyme/RimJ/RimL family protein N-acetyltransferase